MADVSDHDERIIKNCIIQFVTVNITNIKQLYSVLY